eukprot:TRINITY_DN1060_c0_g2_i1.p1 TRINITY_DN1060_c0_g2~~TRINITY_DN1060_c0_g2_i1.p1  ORF type:complete len:826 (+),score=183.74 TRINITY_DN1060_c0_g2_i1:257-2734(+)
MSQPASVTNLSPAALGKPASLRSPMDSPSITCQAPPGVPGLQRDGTEPEPVAGETDSPRSTLAVAAMQAPTPQRYGAKPRLSCRRANRSSQFGPAYGSEAKRPSAPDGAPLDADLNVTITHRTPARHRKAIAEARGTVMRKSDMSAPAFDKIIREVSAEHFADNEECPHMASLLRSDAPVFGLFSYVEPFSWPLLQQMYSAYPAVHSFLRDIGDYLEELRPGARVVEKCCSLMPNHERIPVDLQTTLSVVLQLCSFYATLLNNTNMGFQAFQGHFSQGGMIGFGPAVLVAIAISTARDYDSFVRCARRAVLMAATLGSLQAKHAAELPDPLPGQSYVLHVHNISLPCLEKLLQKCNTRDHAESVVVVSCVVASRSFFLSGHPSDLDHLRSVLQALAGRGFKFGTRFLEFYAPQSSAFYNTELAEDLLSAWQGLGIELSGDDLAFDVLSPVNGKSFTECAEDLLFELSNVMTTQHGSSTAQHAHLPFKSGIISFEVQPNPAQLGSHNLICSQLMLQTPYTRCVSQPYSFAHAKPSLTELHPRNTTRSSRENVLRKLAIMQEILKSLGFEQDLQLVESWLEHGVMEPKVKADETSTPVSDTDRRRRLSVLFNQFSPAPAAHRMSVGGDHGTPRMRANRRSVAYSSESASPAETGLLEDEELEEDLLRDVGDIARSSNLYNLERLESMGTLLVERTELARRFLQALSEETAHFFPASSLHKCPNVIYLIEYWDILDFVSRRTNVGKMSPRELAISPAPSKANRKLSQVQKAAEMKAAGRRSSVHKHGQDRSDSIDSQDDHYKLQRKQYIKVFMNGVYGRSPAGGGVHH